MTKYIEMKCDQAVAKLKRKFPYGWDLNIYRGCEHECVYCFAMYTHSYLQKDTSHFYDEIYFKGNIVEQLEKQLSSPKWKREVINIGGVTDSYQPLEAQLKLMPQILRLFIKYKTPCIISTKSTLILRDYELIKELSEVAHVNIAATITTMDESVRKLIEPQGAPTIERFKMLEKMRETKATIGVHIMPIIPYLTDSKENLDQIFLKAKEINATYVLPGALYLRGKTKPYFMNFIRLNYPEYYDYYQELYLKGKANDEYKVQLYTMINEIRKKYGISSSYKKPMEEEWEKQKQLNLFEDECDIIKKSKVIK